MIGPAAVLLPLLATATAGCAPIPPPLHPDPGRAAVYLAVGEEELRLGHVDTARAALRAALESDPSNAPAAAAYAVLCEGPALPDRALPAPAEQELAPELEACPDGFGSPSKGGQACLHGTLGTDAIALAEKRLEAGDCAGALRALAGAPGDPEGALLGAICLHELGRDREAEARLTLAAGHPELADSAHLLEAVMAFDAGETGRAAALLDSGAHDPSSPEGRAALDLRRLVRRGQRAILALALAADLLYDTNPALTPSDPSAVPASTLGGGDGALRAAVLASFAPWREPGPYLRLGGEAVKQLQLSALDALTGSGAAGGVLGMRDKALAVEYAYTRTALGGVDDLSAHDLELRGWSLPPPFALQARYRARFQEFFPSAAAGYSGLVHLALAELDWHISGFLWVGASGQIVRHQARDATLRHTGGGGGLLVGLRPLTDLRLYATLQATERAYDAASAPDGGSPRRDVDLDARADGELALGDRVALVVSGALHRTISNVAAQDFWRGIVSTGVRYAHDLL